VRVGGRSDVDVLIVEGVKEGDRVSLVSPKSGSNRGGTR